MATTLVERYFSQIDLDAIEKAVHNAESTTGGEIAVELASHSRNWRLESSLCGLVVSVIAALAALYVTRENNWGVYYNSSQALTWGIIGFIVAFFAGGRLLKHRSRRQKVVWHRAVKRFRLLKPVRNLAGVLIFVSLAENEAALVADTGIASKSEPGLWIELRAALIEAMKHGNHAEGIIETVKAVGAEMTRHFPRESDDVNELPDKPTILD